MKMNKRKSYYSASILISAVLLLIVAGCNSFNKSGNEYKYPVKLSGDNRFLTDQNNKPFFWAGDAAWSLIVQLKREDVDYYLDNRKQKGFTILLVNLIDHKFGSNAPANFYNKPPFLDKPFTTPNESYFIHADYVIRAAAQRGIVILLCPLYLGWDFGDDGWGAEVKSADIADMRNWGQYVGKRYADDDNIIWCIGGDTDPSPQKDKVLECVKGILEFDNRHLFTSHNHPEFLTVSPWEGEDWLDINNVYSYSKTIYELCRKAYDHDPVMPYFMMESAYENEHNATYQRLRCEAYWPMLCGAMGYIFGNCPIWHFGSTPDWCGPMDWKEELNQPGSVNMDYVQKLFRSRPWHLLVPDFDHKVITEGYGEWGSENYIITARSSNSVTMIAYLPEQRQVTVDMSQISGENAICWWYDPMNGETTGIDTFATSGSRRFTPPSDRDWILVIDDISANFSAPGSKQLF
jgi:hypothetical protein